jgi:hypothetical protein
MRGGDGGGEAGVEGQGIGGGGAADLIFGCVEGRGKAGDHGGQSGGFVALASEWHRTDVGCVGFKDKGLDGKGLALGPKIFAAGKGDSAADSQEESEVESLLGLSEISGPAVHDTSYSCGIGGRGKLISEDGEAIGIGFAAVDDNGEVKLEGEGELSAEGAALVGPVAFILIVIIETHFPDSHDLGMGQKFFAEGAFFIGAPLVGIVGMDTSSDPEKIGMVLGHGEGATAIGAIRAHENDGTNSGLAGPFHCEIPVILKLSMVQMGVGIDDHGQRFWIGDGGRKGHSFSFTAAEEGSSPEH